MQDFIELLKVLAPVLATLVALFSVGISFYFNTRTFKRQQHEDELKEIYKKLNSFYGPYQQLLETSRQLSEILRLNKSKDFRVLTSLLKGEKFEKNDKALFEEILEIVKQLERIRIEQAGLIDDPQLERLLAKAGAHFRILELAYREVLTGELSRFENYVYPRELNEKIDNKIKELQDKLNELNSM
jgi:hypothetical protein